jgi:quinol monooxygenase YgiN
MIVITGAVTAKPGSFELLKAEGVAHSARSRTEDGCLSHRCYIDADAPDRLFFHEEWRDMAAVEAHFRHPDTGRIMAAIRAHAAASEGPVLLEAVRVGR